MEENEIVEKKVEEVPMEISQASKSYLKELSGWAMFLSVMGFITVGFLALAGIILPFIFSAIPEIAEINPMFALGSIFLSIVYFLLALIYFFPVLYLFKFASKTKKALFQNSSEVIEDAFKNLKSSFKFVGIMTIVIISFYILMAVVMIAAGGLAALIAN